MTEEMKDDPLYERACKIQRELRATCKSGGTRDKFNLNWIMWFMKEWDDITAKLRRCASHDVSKMRM